MHKYTHLLCCYFPTTAVVIGDPYFLDSVKRHFSPGLSLQLFDNPLYALEYLNTLNSSGQFSKSWANRDASKKQESACLDININTIHQEIYNPERFKQVSVVIIDNATQEMNGIEFFNQLSDRNIKRVILTNEAEYNSVSEAFNQGVIDKFILKGTLQQMRELKQAIGALQWAFFQELSTAVMDSLTPDPVTCLIDPVFTEYCYKLFAEHNVKECYLLDMEGSYLCLDGMANPGWLIVRDEQAMEMYTEMAMTAQAPWSVVRALRDRIKLPYFHEGSLTDAAPDHWESYLYPAKVLVGKQRYYYYYLNHFPIYPKESEKILPYQTFLAG